MLNIAPCHDAGYTLREVTHDAASYYLREGEAPGRWWGDYARVLGLSGEVDPAALRDLFEGKHPNTGAYLIPARGSSARSNDRRAKADLDVAAAAAELGLTGEGVRARLRAGILAGEKTPHGRWRVPAAAIDAYRSGRPQPPSPGPLPTLAQAGTYSLAEAARVAGVNVSYLRRLARGEPPQVRVQDNGRAVQFLVGRRDERNHWRVAASELERFMAARTAPVAVPAYDLVLRPPKSVSILHALGHLVPAERLAAVGLPASVASEVLASHHAAVSDALEVLQRHAAWVRGPGGRVQATGFAAALFDHRSSRTGDPLLHTHAVVLNLAIGVDGRRAALDGTALYAWGSTAGHVYQARLRAELVARLGVAFHQPHHGMADVVGIPRELIDEFSERRRQILELMRQLGSSGPRAAQIATLATRPPKDEHSHQSPDQLAARAGAQGFGAEELLAVLGHSRQREVSQRELGEVAARLASPEGLTARATLVDLRDAIKGFATELASGASAAQLQRWGNALLHAQRFIPVLGAPTRSADVIRRADGRRVRAGGMGRTYSTPELLAHEAALVAAHADGLGHDGKGVGLGLADDVSLRAALDGRPTLSDEQVTMVRRITTSGRGVEVVVGGPGAGKTFALGAAAEAWRDSGLRVVGAALAGGAAEVLAAEAQLDRQHTLTGLLRRCDHEGAGYLARSVVVVDEAGMADTRQLSRLARYAAAAKAKLVLVGDPDQLPEVRAGGAFAHLVATLGDDVVALRENRRQRHAPDRERLELIRRGRATAAIESAVAHGRWHTAGSGDELRLGLLADWCGDPASPGVDKLMIAPTVAEVEWLNRGARALLAAEGRLGSEALTIPLRAPDRAVETRELRVGDVVRATRNDWDTRIFTGSVGTITAVDTEACRVTVALHGGRGLDRRVILDAEFLHERRMSTPAGRVRVDAPGLTHAYASTVHSVQGRTALRAYVLIAEAGMSRQAAYVMASRAALETRFYGLGAGDASEVDHLDRRGASVVGEDVAGLAEAMARDASQTMASVADPAAAEIGRLMTRPTSWLWAEYHELAARSAARPPLAESLRRVRTALADTYGLDPAALECAPLTSALTRAVEVPAATPDAVVDLVLRRQRDDTRELASADDPMAVLVWAAGHAGEFLAVGAPEPDDVSERLRLLDVALTRQRQGRLALAETERHGPIWGLLGPPPRTAAGLAAWRRAAAAVVDYRDASGLFDRDTGDSSPWHRALGGRPHDLEVRRHYEQVRTVVDESLTAVVLAELAQQVRAAGPRPPARVEELARRPLRELDSELAGTEAQRRFSHPPAVPAERADLVRQATAVRAERVRTGVLTDPPAWVRADVARRVQRHGPAVGAHVSELAELYGELAVHAERSGADPEASSVESVLGRPPSSVTARGAWRELAARLDGIGVEPAHGIDLAP